LAFFGATLRPGFDIIADAIRLRDRIKQSDCCLTGEGRLDASSLAGKAAVGVARVCNSVAIPCAVIAGQIDEDFRRELDSANDKLFAARYSLSDAASSSDQAIARAPDLIAAAAGEAIRRFAQHGP